MIVQSYNTCTKWLQHYQCNAYNSHNKQINATIIIWRNVATHPDCLVSPVLQVRAYPRSSTSLLHWECLWIIFQRQKGGESSYWASLLILTWLRGGNHTLQVDPHYTNHTLKSVPTLPYPDSASVPTLPYPLVVTTMLLSHSSSATLSCKYHTTFY